MFEYRNDSAFGDGFRDAVDVIAYEVFELGNIDSIEYILEHYAVSDSVADEWSMILDEYDENDYDYVTDENDMPYHADSENAKNKVRALLSEVSRVSGVDIRHVLWLASEKSVRSRYDGDDENIEAYDIDSGVILSDLGFDGRLYGFSELPEGILLSDLVSEERSVAL